MTDAPWPPAMMLRDFIVESCGNPEVARPDCPSTRANYALAQDKILLRCQDALRCACLPVTRHGGQSAGKLRTNFLLRKILEAGGVEPPSEKPCRRKTTCLSRSGAAVPCGIPPFASDAQSEQETKPASPMISPARYGPKRASQPTL